MRDLDLVGVRFSSAKPPNPTYIAWGSERAGALVVDGVDPVGVTLAERLAKGPPRVLGLDVPLGVPVSFARALNPLATNGHQILEHLVATPPSQLDAAWAQHATEHPDALRLTDALTHGTTSVMAPRPPHWRGLRALAQMLWPLRDRVAIVPFDTLELSPARPMVLEVSPAAMLRVLGLPWRLHHAAADVARPQDVTAERLMVIRGLADALAPYGVRMDFTAHVAAACAQDNGGDALDAVLSLVAVHLATRGQWAPPPWTGYHATRALTEGWIVRPG